MEDWRAKIRSRIDEYESKRMEIYSVLDSLINELTSSPYYIKAKITGIEPNLTWQIEIHNKKLSISAEEIDEKQDYGLTIKEAIKELILDKFMF